MRINKRSAFLFLIFFLLFAFTFSFLAPTATAQTDIPASVQKTVEAQNETASTVLRNVSLLIAFVAGVLSILSPCTYALIPAFFAYTFREKTEITKMTSIFFLGFAIVFTIMGILAASLGKLLLSYQQQNLSFIIFIGGLVIVIMGLITLFGKGFSGLKIQKKTATTKFGIFLFGIFFALGWTACTGPILAGILTMATVIGNYLWAGLLLISYSLGIFVPLFIISMFYDRFDLGHSKWMRGKVFRFGEIEIHSTSAIAGIIMVLIGLMFVIFRDSAIFNTWDIFHTKRFFYLFEDKLLTLPYADIIGLVALVAFVLLIIIFFKKFHKVYK